MTGIDKSRDHHMAIYELLAPLTDLLGYQRFYGEVDVPDADLKYPHLIVWATPGTGDILNLAGNLSDFTTTTQLTGVGQDVNEVGAVLDRAFDLLQGVRPKIPGRLPGRIHSVPSGEAIRASDTLRTPAGRRVWRGVALYELNSTAAPVPTA